jgi:hypothetical protein
VCSDLEIFHELVVFVVKKFFELRLLVFLHSRGMQSENNSFVLHDYHSIILAMDLKKMENRKVELN